MGEVLLEGGEQSAQLLRGAVFEVPAEEEKAPGVPLRASSSQPVSGKRTQNSWPAFSSGVMVSTMAWSSSSWVGGSGSGAG